jgi:hypothetical protein
MSGRSPTRLVRAAGRPAKPAKTAGAKPFPDRPTPAIPYFLRSANRPSQLKCDMGCLYPQGPLQVDSSSGNAQTLVAP